MIGAHLEDLMRLHEFLDYWAGLQPDVEFAVFGDETLSYGEAAARSHRMARAFVAWGLEPGDRVAVLAKNCAEYVLLYYAASRVGVVPVPLNYRLAGPEWAWIINDSAARVLVARGEFVAGIEAIADDLEHVRHKIAMATEHAGWDSWDAALDAQSSEKIERRVEPSEPLYQMYTSGTTGRPKGAVLSQQAVCTNLFQFSMQLRTGPGERTLIVAPLYHAAAAIVSFGTVLSGGALFIQEDFDPNAVVEALSEERIAFAMLVPAMIQFCLLAVPDAAKREYPALKTVAYGASAIAEQTLRQALETFRCDFVQAYGMTETTAVATNLLPEDHLRALRDRPDLLLSAGRAVLGTALRIVDVDGNDLPHGEIGEILVRGPQLMTEYWNRDEATRETLRDGWLHTGDAGILDADGYLFIQDRVKDMIVSGGENVYPREIEEVLYQHSAVAEAAVIGVPDERWGESVKAIVVLKPGVEPDADSILQFCAGKLGGYKQPRSVDFIEALPRNLSGKVLKKDLREPYWQGKTRRVN
jgi:fatty-acyl-CoA synthase